jgi:8-amino-7-oxononanoate synthase
VAIDLVAESDDRRKALRGKAERWRAALREGGLDTGPSTTQIVPMIVGESTAALELAWTLADREILAVAIRPPTVPRGQARIRFSLMATHEDADLDRAARDVVQAARDLGLVS